MIKKRPGTAGSHNFFNKFCMGMADCENKIKERESPTATASETFVRRVSRMHTAEKVLAQKKKLFFFSL